jgi:hypothetical protein
MPLSRNPNHYADIKQVLDTAIASGGLIFKVRNASGNYSAKQATHWLQRVRHFCRLLRDRDEELRGPGTFGQSPYDVLHFRRACGCQYASKCAMPTACEGHVIEITVGVAVNLVDDMTTLDGKPVDAVASAPAEVKVEDDLLLEALTRRKDLGLE